MQRPNFFSRSLSKALTCGGAVLVGSMLAAATLAACSGPDPQAYVIGDPPGTSSGNVVSDSGTTLDGGSKSDAAGDGGNGADAAVDAAPAPDAIFNNTAYASNLPATSAKTAHTNAGQGQVPGRDVDCMGCHNNNTKKFLAAGTTSDANGAPIPDVEVWIQDSAGKKYKVNSDADGNYWFVASAGGAPATFAVPAKAAARKNANYKLMKANVNAAGCNNGTGCHGTGGKPLAPQ